MGKNAKLKRLRKQNITAQKDASLSSDSSSSSNSNSNSNLDLNSNSDPNSNPNSNLDPDLDQPILDWNLKSNAYVKVDSSLNPDSASTAEGIKSDRVKPAPTQFVQQFEQMGFELENGQRAPEILKRQVDPQL
ncbi:MAG: hypothetical protein HC825_11110 [Oscillatoriales cyanobacterium RM1_1_9]|nr:hypothetical protein [Oscillatoriales cyanobacterium SM2_3_0]NJO46233.1 hypothetical protein [Oscillatoriales cyanobacterium RM2_1_1]NJO72065.1 hypothetical protein [Oscillatoriales cyanobacterium RM1_1_9]